MNNTEEKITKAETVTPDCSRWAKKIKLKAGHFDIECILIQKHINQKLPSLQPLLNNKIEHKVPFASILSKWNIE